MNDDPGEDTALSHPFIFALYFSPGDPLHITDIYARIIVYMIM